MIAATDEFKSLLAEGIEPLYEELDVTFPDGTKRTFLNEISPDGSEFSDGAGDSSFPIGSVICKTLIFDLDNTDGELDEKKFYGARIAAYLTFLNEDETKVRIRKGIYNVTDSKGYDEVVSVTAMDDIAKTNQLYMSGLTLPQTVDTIINDICTTLGISKGFTRLKHGTYIINDIPEKVTYRQMIGYIAAINCANARIDVDGYLQMIKWNFSDIDNVSVLEDFEDSPEFSQDDIIITGVRIQNGELEYLYGSSGYVIEIENGLVDEQSIQTVSAWIGDTIIGVPFRSMDGKLIHDPLIEFGDVVKSEDRKGISYLTPITDVTYVHFGLTEVKTAAQDPESTISTYESGTSKVYEDAKRYTKQQISAVNKNMEKLDETIANSSGMYSTREVQLDGSVITYYHDKPELKKSTNVLKFTSVAIGISNDGGKTYPYGIVLDGTFIAKQLYSVGINADYITAGNFQIVDESGKVLFSADKDLKRVYFDASNVFIGENSITKRIEDLQNQTDGNIQTWTSSPEPTLSNYPASQWLTDDERSKHVGDIYYDSNNQAYRFRYDSGGYNWQRLKDTDVTKALQDAEAAKKQAENAENIAALAKNVTLQLSNDYATVSVDSDGNYARFPDITVKPVVMYGLSNITTECIYSIQQSDSVSGTWNNDTFTYTVTGLSTDNGWVDIRATYLGALSVIKRFNISKLYQGKKGDPGKSIVLDVSNAIVRKTAKNVLNPDTIVFSASYIDENESWKSYNTIFVIEETTDNLAWKEVYRSSAAESSVKHFLYTALSGTGNIGIKNPKGYCIAVPREILAVRCSIYNTNNDLIDRQTVSVVYDITALTQEQIVDILSNDGQWKGMYYLNGHLYLSFDAALGGTLTLGGVNNGNGLLRILDASGKQVGYIDNTGVNFTQGKFSGKIYGTQITGSTISGSTLNGTTINGGNINGATVTVGGKDNGNGLLKILDEKGKQIGYINNTGVNFEKGKFSGELYGTKITGSTISGSTLSAPTINGGTITVDSGSTATRIDGGNIRLKSTKLGTVDESWTTTSDIANAGYIQTKTRYYPDFASSSVIVEDNVAVIDLNAFWGLFIAAEKKDIASFGAGQVNLYGALYVGGDADISGDAEVKKQLKCKQLITDYLVVTGTKNRVVDTENYQKQYLHAFEMPAPMFGDCGSSQLNETGEDLVPIDDILLEVINSGIEYQVFLQKEGPGDIWVEEKTPLYFSVKGTPNLKYSWEIKALQKDYEHIRFDDISVVLQDTEIENYDTDLEEMQKQELNSLDEEERQLLTDLLAENERGMKNESNQDDIHHESGR